MEMVDMDFSGCGASGDSSRKMLELTDSDCAEVVPLELYDSSRAKIAANLAWIFSKAYGIDNIPEDLRDAFYTDQYEQEHIKPPVIKLLLSSELYCRVCSLILKGDQVAALQGHQPVIQALSRKGIYVMESDDVPVSESDLTQSPIKMSAHMALIDALMMAYTVEMISIETVVASVKRFSTFSASKELPYDLEDAMVFWINKVNLKMREITEKELKLKQQIVESPSHQKSPSKWYWKLVPVRYRRDHPLNKQLPFFPLMEDLMRDVCDGCSLLAVIHYYCPELMKLEDICLKEVTSIADSLYNIQLLLDFSHHYLNRSFYLTLEDMLYSPLVLKPNIMVFIAELFWWFEVVKPDFVQPREVQEIKDAKTLLQQKSSRPPLPISNATKRSFMVSPANGPGDMSTPVLQSNSEIATRYCLHPEEFVKGSPAFSPSHPLLPLRQRQYKCPLSSEDNTDTRHRSNSLTRVDGKPRGAVLAWQERKPRPLSQPTPFNLHYATDSDVDAGSGDSISLARSISKDSLASNIVSVTPKHQSQLLSPPAESNGKSLLRNVDMEDEDDEELIAIIKSDGQLVNDSDLELQSVSSKATSQILPSKLPKRQQNDLDVANQTGGFCLEPLMPAVLKPAKENLLIVNKHEEYGERKYRPFSAKRIPDGHLPSTRKKAVNINAEADINRTFTPITSSDFIVVSDPTSEKPLQHLEEPGVSLSHFRPLASSSVESSTQGEPGGFFLHTGDLDEELDGMSINNTTIVSNSKPCDTTWTMNMQDSDSEVLDMEEADQDLVPDEEVQQVKSGYSGEEESRKLHHDMKVKEHEDKDGASGRSSPCLSTISQASSTSMTSTSIRMTSFAERKLQRLNSAEAKSSASSSQKTTPDGSECCPLPMMTWRQKREQSPNRQTKDSAQMLASELVQLHMQLEEKRRKIEAQKKKMETLSARQRLKLGKAAFLHIVKKGKNEGIPQPLKPEYFTKEAERPNNEETVANVSQSPRADEDFASQEAKEDCLKELEEVGAKDLCEKITENDIQESIAAVRQRWLRESSQAAHDVDKNKVNSNGGFEDGMADVDINEYNRSIEKLNETLSNLQFEMHKLSQQQELLMKIKDQTPTAPLQNVNRSLQDQKVRQAVQTAEPLSATGISSLQAVRKQPRGAPMKSPRSARPTELKMSRDSKMPGSFRIITPTHSVETLPHLRPSPGSKPLKSETDDIAVDGSFRTGTSEGRPSKVSAEQSSERTKDADCLKLGEESNQRALVLSTSQKDSHNYFYEQINTEAVVSTPKKPEYPALISSDRSGKENIPIEEQSKNKANLIEVDISELKSPAEGETAESQGLSTSQMISESDQKSGLGFFFKDDQKAEDELAKKRAAFLLKQQRKAEEARIRRQQLDAEIEQKRDEARRKAEEDRIRKEEEKARRELIKQEYLRRKQQQILEEQGLGKPKPKVKKQRPKSVHREESCSEPPSQYPSTPDNLSSAQSGSSLSLASAATTEAESVNSGGGSGSGGYSQRTDSMETFSVLSRNPSRNTERDWENASTASSIASVAEYTGPKLFKEPSSKSNKPILHNAISHCCLAGKVNEAQKNSILEELEKCEANHYIILFRDAGCQFRALYAYSPDSEEIQKLTGTGPKNINKKMIDKLYKYSSDRKLFSLIPTKTMSVSVDAITIHNHLWQIKRSAVPKKQSTGK
ncbi:calmodulin-regulated spectrin-associated protein 1-B isoform X3 [Scyliorhinus canicula]|uniref:calmodulin-regulated spectrin-associated protein 1-B isoform X3 n=1 Tax=Scyliorhinus canicula TaxID=7830 RepID=UPI0018F2E73B|nr:calmodulin-regulated spectrin-associated protein 1-B isoform X3 [Scyliorhinus canicula]